LFRRILNSEQIGYSDTQPILTYNASNESAWRVESGKITFIGCKSIFNE